MAQVSDYTGLITSEHADKPKFMAMVAAVAQCAVDQMTLLQSMPTAFDLDAAVGVQLDAVGIWVGLNRNIAVPIDNVYFSWDTAGVGWDQGVWKQPGDPDNGITRMDDGSSQTDLLYVTRMDGEAIPAELEGHFTTLTIVEKIIERLP